MPEFPLCFIVISESVDAIYFCTRRNLVNAHQFAAFKDDFLMSVIAPRDTAPRYKSLFPFGERRSVPFFFFTGYPEDRDPASIIPKMGTRNDGVTRTHMRLHFRTIRTAEFSAR